MNKLLSVCICSFYDCARSVYRHPRFTRHAHNEQKKKALLYCQQSPFGPTAVIFLITQQLSKQAWEMYTVG